MSPSRDAVTVGEGLQAPPPAASDERRWAAWFHELDAWTEYWDLYHPETRGRFYFGDGRAEPGLLTAFLPRYTCPAPFVAWKRLAFDFDDGTSFAASVHEPTAAAAILEVDALVARLFREHFGDAADTRVQADYLEATHRMATDTLPPATEREALVADDDPRKSTAGRHAIEGDLMWFAWAMQLEAARAIVGADGEHPRRALQLAGVVAGCAANFAWRGHRRTRHEYGPDMATARLLRRRALRWAADFDAAAREIHTLFQIREFGEQG